MPPGNVDSPHQCDFDTGARDSECKVDDEMTRKRLYDGCPSEADASIGVFLVAKLGFRGICSRVRVIIVLKRTDVNCYNSLIFLSLQHILLSQRFLSNQSLSLEKT